MVVGFRLVGASARIVRRHPVLLVPGLLQTAAMLLVLVVVLLFAADSGAHDDDWSVGDVAVFAGALLSTSFLGVWSGAVVVAMTSYRLDGASMSLRGGIAAANRHLPTLFGWALISATVGTLLRLVEERLGGLGRAVTGAAGVLFSLGTVLVVPVLVLEDLRPLPAVRRSAALFRERFGATTGGEVGIHTATGLAYLAALLLTYPLHALSATAWYVLVGVLLVVQLTVSSVLHAVFSAALHRFVTGSPLDDDFGDLTGLFTRRRAALPAPISYGPHGRWDAS